jgi:UrcA family protein
VRSRSSQNHHEFIIAAAAPGAARALTLGAFAAHKFSAVEESVAMRPVIRTLSATLLLATTLPAIAQASAASQPLADRADRVGSIVVRYHDLDLRKEADAQVLLQRLERAAKTACGGNPKMNRAYEAMPRYTVEVFRECRREAIERAVTQINAPTLSHLFAALYGTGSVSARSS